MGSFKKQRVGELLQAFVAEEIRRLEDPRFFCVTITAVDMSPDLRNARIFWTVPPPASSADAPDGEPRFADKTQIREIEEALGQEAWHLKRRIAAELGLRYVPELRFRYDESAANASRIDFLIRKAT